MPMPCHSPYALHIGVLYRKETLMSNENDRSAAPKIVAISVIADAESDREVVYALTGALWRGVLAEEAVGLVQ